MSDCNIDKNCTSRISSSCVSWQGDIFEDFNICAGVSLSYVTGIVLAKIKDILQGKGILLPDLDLTDSDFLSDLLGTKEKNLLNILDTYKQGISGFRADLDTNIESLESFYDITVYNLGVITPGGPCELLSFKDLIQSVLNKLQDLDTQYKDMAEELQGIVDQTVSETLLSGTIKSAGGNGISKVGTGADGTLVFTALVPPYCPIVYTGSTTYFDITGRGKDGTAYQGWRICNGNNGTPNSSTLPQNSSGNLVYIIRFD